MNKNLNFYTFIAFFLRSGPHAMAPRIGYSLISGHSAKWTFHEMPPSHETDFHKVERPTIYP